MLGTCAVVIWVTVQQLGRQVSADRFTKLPSSWNVLERGNESVAAPGVCSVADWPVTFLEKGADKCAENRSFLEWWTQSMQIANFKAIAPKWSVRWALENKMSLSFMPPEWWMVWHIFLAKANTNLKCGCRAKLNYLPTIFY